MFLGKYLRIFQSQLEMNVIRLVLETRLAFTLLCGS